MLGLRGGDTSGSSSGCGYCANDNSYDNYLLLLLLQEKEILWVWRWTYIFLWLHDSNNYTKLLAYSRRANSKPRVANDDGCEYLLEEELNNEETDSENHTQVDDNELEVSLLV